MLYHHEFDFVGAEEGVTVFVLSAFSGAVGPFESSVCEDLKPRVPRDVHLAIFTRPPGKGIRWLIAPTNLDPDGPTN